MTAPKPSIPVLSEDRALGGCSGFMVQEHLGVAGSLGQALECSVGVMAYNEQDSIADALGSILGQNLGARKVTELIVVASGCTDRTCAIVADIACRETRVRLIEQDRREGKASAVNLFISAARSPVLVMVSADVLVKDGAFNTLLRHFDDPSVGMVGGQPTPVNNEMTFMGHAVHLQWRLHDRIARESPKLGEIVAFRNVVPSIPLDTPVDEISIQALITQLGYRLVYEPRAVIYNRGPETVSDFLRQRRRIYAGHLQVRNQQGYSAPTMSARRILRALRGSGFFATPHAFLWSLGTAGLEVTARALGAYEVSRHRAQHVWKISGTTKQKITEDAKGPGQYSVAVFHIVNFHRYQIEAGLHASRQLTRVVVGQVKRALGPEATVAAQQAGTVIALVPGDRDAAERPARELVRQFDEAVTVPLDGCGATRVTLTCGIIAFPQAGPPLARSIHLPVLEAGPAQSADWKVRLQ